MIMCAKCLKLKLSSKLFWSVFTL